MLTQSYNELSKRSQDVGSELFARDRTLNIEKSRLDNLTAMVEKNRADIDDFKAAINLCRACIQEQSSAKEHIENILTALVNGVMQSVHDFYDLAGDRPTYEYRLEAVESVDGALTGLKPVVYKNGIADDPRGMGGGVQNLLRFGGDLLNVLLNPRLSPVLVLDEPMTNLSPKAWPFVVRFLTDLQQDLGIQVIAITHSGAQFPTTWVVWREGDTSYVRVQPEGD